MTDLRTRIAELQRAHMPIDYAGGIDCTCGDNFHPDHGGIDVAEPLWAAHVADAVIRELDLGIPCATTGCRMRQIARRAQAAGGADDSFHSKENQ